MQHRPERHQQPGHRADTEAHRVSNFVEEGVKADADERHEAKRGARLARRPVADLRRDDPVEQVKQELAGEEGGRRIRRQGERFREEVQQGDCN